MGLFLWIFPGEFNLLDSGYANIDSLFVLAPWVFMFLGPAITMKMFSEEQRAGTLELLLTKPLTEWQLVIAKFFAGWTLVLFSLLPTLLYYYSIYELGATPGNLDSGAIWGSYVGLLFLSGGFIAIGVFASSLSSSQIVAFILAVFLSFIMYIGFDSIAALDLFGPVDLFIQKLGINEHYISLSRGVIDSRDVLYFFSLMLLFLALTKLKLDSRKW